MRKDINQTALEQMYYKMLELVPPSKRDLCEELLEQYKEIDKAQMIEFAQEVFRGRHNQITQSLGNIADDIYKQTFGGNK